MSLRTVAPKFNNFKNFVKENAPNSILVNILLNSELPIFLSTIRSHSDSGKKDNQILASLLKKANIKREDIDDEIFKKFCRYLEYFRKVSYVVI